MHTNIPNEPSAEFGEATPKEPPAECCEATPNEPPAECGEATTTSQTSPTNSSDGLPCTDEGAIFFNQVSIAIHLLAASIDSVTTRTLEQTKNLYDIYPIGGGFQPLGLRTGFTPPYPINQVLTVFVFLLAIAESFLVMIPSLPVCIVGPIAGTVLTFLSLGTIIFWVRTSIIDPADKRVLKKIGEIIEVFVEEGNMQLSSSCGGCLYAAMNKQALAMPKGSTFGSTKFCSLCDIDVHVDSAHCLRCGMCVYRYDHHCSSKWFMGCCSNSHYEHAFIVSY